MKLVLLPGLDGSGLLFRPFIEQLPEDIEPLVITYPAERKLAYQELVEWVIARLPGKEDFILLGESFSGPVAYEIACRKPFHLKSVIFVATFLQSPRPSLLHLSRLLPLQPLFSLPVPEYVLKTWLFDRATDPQVLGLFEQAMRKIPNDLLVFRLAEIARLKNKIEPCAVPGLYIRASHDRLVPPACANVFEEVMANIHVVTVDGPHFLLQANPAACVEVVVREVGRRTGRGRQVNGL